MSNRRCELTSIRGTTHAKIDVEQSALLANQKTVLPVGRHVHVFDVRSRLTLKAVQKTHVFLLVQSTWWTAKSDSCTILRQVGSAFLIEYR